MDTLINTVQSIGEHNVKYRCGEILLIKNEWQLMFSCAFCDFQFLRLDKFLKHTLQKHLSVPKRTISALVRGIFTANMLTTEVAEVRQFEDDEDELIYEEAFLEENILTKTDETDEDYDQDSICELIDDDCNSKLSEFYIDPLLKRETNEETKLEIEFIKKEENNEERSQPQNQKLLQILNYENHSKIINNSSADNADIINSFVCEICGKLFSNRIQLRKHTRTHSILKPYACEYCDAVFSKNSNLIMHRNRHLGIKPHTCSTCNKSFVSSSELKLHIRSHTGERPYICDDCGQSFKNSAHLGAHRRRHLNQRPHVCNVCDKGFFHKRLLRDHWTVHTMDRPFVCDICNMTFSLRKTLREHSRLHSGIKKYCCKICEKTFAQNAGLNSHMKKYHGVKWP